MAKILGGMAFEVKPPFPGPKKMKLQLFIDGQPAGRGEFMLWKKAEVEFPDPYLIEDSAALKFDLAFAEEGESCDPKHQMISR